MKILLMITVFSVISCTKYNEDKCQELAFKAYHGQPNASNQLKNNCQNYKIKITPNDCQKAFVAMADGMIEGNLKQKFGNKILACFTKKDKKLLLRK